MKTYISNFGFDTQPVYRCIIRHGINPDDNIVLLQTQPDNPRAESSVAELREILRKIHPDISIDQAQVEPMMFEETTEKITGILNDAEGEVIVNMSGGDRAVLVALSVAVTITETDIEHVTLFSDTERQQLEPDYPSFNVKLGENDEVILRHLARNGAHTNQEIADATGLAKSTVSERLDSLAGDGYVELVREGKSNRVEPRLAGRLIALDR